MINIGRIQRYICISIFSRCCSSEVIKIFQNAQINQYSVVLKKHNDCFSHVLSYEFIDLLSAIALFLEYIFLSLLHSTYIEY